VQGSRFHPKDEGGRYRYVAYALYRRTGEAMTVRERVNRLLAPANGSFDPGDGLGREMAVIVCGDLNNEPDAATTPPVSAKKSTRFDPSTWGPNRRPCNRPTTPLCGKPFACG
jgi:hypothetical protein